MKSHRYPAIMGDERPDDGGMLFLASVSFPRSLPETVLYAKPVAVMTVIKAKGVHDGRGTRDTGVHP